MSRVDRALRAANDLLTRSQPAQAREMLSAAVKQDPKSPHLLHALATAHHQLGDHDKALSIISSLARNNDVAEVHFTYGIVLKAMGRYDGALAELRRAAALRPRSAQIQTELASTLLKMAKLGEAIEHGRLAMELSPGDAAAAGVVLVALNAAGLSAQAYETASSILERRPNDLNAAAVRAFSGNYLDTLTPEQVFEDHQAFGEISRRSAPRARTTPTAFANARDPDRQLRIAFLSQDLRTHSVAFFLEPLLAAIDRSRFAVHIFSATLLPDARTERFRALADVWTDVARQPAPAVAESVRQQGVDVLIDLGGLTSPHLLTILEHDLAPVQATYLGYPNTTGLTSVGYRFADSHTDPPGAEKFCVEKLVRLDPCFLCFQPPDESPPPTSPAQRAPDAPITFASFNVLQKISDTTVSLWTRVLAATPNSRLLMKTAALGDERRRKDLHARFANAGISPDRVELLGRTESLADHFKAYERTDIALDTFPYHGTTTTCDALWMEIPVVTLAGSTHAARVGVSLLNAVGLPELVAHTHEEFLAIALRLAADQARRNDLRTGLRERMRASPLCDSASFAKRFEHAVRGLWREWCEGGVKSETQRPD